MSDRFTRFPAALASQTRRVAIGGTIPALLAHPDWSRPAPVVLWMHGRTANKELDPGRYLRWLRAGIATCSVDLPGHGERSDPSLQEGAGTMRVLAQMRSEIDQVVEHLRTIPAFDVSRLAIGGMSAGGMVTLRRLCDPHPFVCAAVEGATGWLGGLYFPHESGAAAGARASATHDRETVRAQDPWEHLDTFNPLPLLALNSESDRIVPYEGMRRFLHRLRGHYRDRGADPALIEAVTWKHTGAPDEHSGFGVVSNDAKNLQTAFLVKHLRPEAAHA
jgi:dienelactone hydrolase